MQHCTCLAVGLTHSEPSVSKDFFYGLGDGFYPDSSFFPAETQTDRFAEKRRDEMFNFADKTEWPALSGESEVVF